MNQMMFMQINHGMNQQKPPFLYLINFVKVDRVKVFFEGKINRTRTYSANGLHPAPAD